MTHRDAFFLLFPCVLSHPVVSFHTMHIYVTITLKCFYRLFNSLTLNSVWKIKTDRWTSNGFFNATAR